VIKKVATAQGQRYEVDYRDPQGRRLRRRFDKKKDADVFEGAVRTAKQTGQFAEIFGEKEKTPTFEEAMKVYVENNRGQKSYSRHKVFHVTTLLEYFAGRDLTKISYKDLETFKNRRKATQTKKGTVRSDAQVNREMAVLKHFFNKCVEWDLLKVTPFKRGSSLMFKEPREHIRFLTGEEAHRLLEECKAIRPVVLAAMLTGMRLNEILTLKWEQVHSGQIHLKAQDNKSNKAREVAISDSLEGLLAEMDQINGGRSPYVFIRPDGRRFLSVRNAFISACSRAGIFNFRFHDLRHTFASQLVMAGADLPSVQKLLGHSDIKMTMRYAHLAPGHLKAAVDKLNDFGMRGGLVIPAADDHRATGYANGQFMDGKGVEVSISATVTN